MPGSTLDLYLQPLPALPRERRHSASAFRFLAIRPSPGGNGTLERAWWMGDNVRQAVRVLEGRGEVCRARWCPELDAMVAPDRAAADWLARLTVDRMWSNYCAVPRFCGIL